MRTRVYVLFSALVAVSIVPFPPAEAAAGRCGSVAVRPWCDRSLSPAKRTALLLKAMSRPEKLDMLAGDDLFGAALSETSAVHREGTLNGVPRLGVPGLRIVGGGAMGVHQGPMTALPSGLALGASFSTAAATGNAAINAVEARHRGNDILLGPAVDIMRTPAAGRAFESFGEDPYLTSRLAVSWIEEVQRGGMIAQVKHFPANNQETDRYSTNAVISQRALREIYLPPFEAAVREAGAGSVMCGYNLVNGKASCASRVLLDTVLRKEWRFRGPVVTDWIAGMKDTGTTVRDGADLEMPIGIHYTAGNLLQAVDNGQATWADIDRRLGATLRMMFRFGLFERAPRANDGKIDYAAHAVKNRRLAEQGITLLKNKDGVLPLERGTRVAVIGKPAAEFRSATGSAYVRPRSHVTPLTALRARGGVTYADGTDLGEAAATARAAKVAIVFVADHREEGEDLACLSLRCGDEELGDQDALVRAVAAANENTIVVMETGGPVLTPWATSVKGVVEAWYPGAQGGPALARVLYGDVDPGGRLPVTFPVRAGDAIMPAGKGRISYAEGVQVGYRRYDAGKLPVRYPFGHGLSYTSFRMSGLKTSGSRVSFTVKNTGRRTGYAVPQLYVRLPGSGQPVQLKGFTKFSLKPGRSRRVVFTLDARSVSTWAGKWKAARGCVAIGVGASSRDLPLKGRLCR
ncbi:beta-glucosidase family protein [Actinocorallia longicatena]|uniref:Glycoside hydrolase family 3 C-terminal domain-containing protein n=1 Tax=Actinocorallia longicatena TaxID=111803 RepID=A0ABP6PXW0_9ACTN